ncbi:O-antigen ligase family protein [Muricauda sp. CAU 1633]|nr:O-antigen ligase family protein [Muricauda sp. CAU 1633]
MGYKTASLIVLTVILSKSSLGFFALLLCLLLIVFSKYPVVKKPIFLSIFGISTCIVAILLYNVPEMKFRVDDTLELFTSNKVTAKQIDKTNLSTYALYSNYSIVKHSMSENPLFGAGLGQYPFIYDKTIEEVVPKSTYRENFRLNREDANSLLFRLLAETGLLGSILFVFFVFNYRIKWSERTSDNHFFWTLNNGIFILIILRLLRQGHYSMLGFALMLFIYFETYTKNKKNVSDIKGIHNT